MTPAVESLSPAEARRRDAFLRLARAVGAYLHESQRERGVSALHVESGRKLFARDLGEQRARTDARARGATTLVESVGPALLGDAPAALDRIGAAVRGVADTRAEIERSAATSGRVVDAFTRLNAELLAAFDDGAAHVSEGPVRGLAFAAVALQHAKEKVGLERARLGAALVAGGLGDADRLALAELIAAQATYLHIYSMTAPTTAAQMLRRVLAAPPALEVKRFEDRLMATSTSRPVAPVDARAWFATISRKIEMLGDVGDATLSFLPTH
ncbi:MAG TPA: nitrate- and nitrite sensing domain-containing protein [Polyangia bacterium]|nr:nitrate- and nitrite sensing domain-containing protein [Polyangia bacterium]